jgi:hypothetical protein
MSSVHADLPRGRVDVRSRHRRPVRSASASASASQERAQTRPSSSLRLTAAGLISTLGAPGCYAGAGPTVGVTFAGRPTIGWEVGGATLALGQSYEAGHAISAEEERGDRTYLAWEPRYGLGHYAEASDALTIYGAGLTLGARMDRLEGRPAFGAIGGFWGGATYVFDDDRRKCAGGVQVYTSFALGMRGEEVYAAPKVGVIDVYCL